MIYKKYIISELFLSEVSGAAQDVKVDVDMEDLIAEVEDRRHRERNVVFYNVDESETSDEDVTKLDSIFELMGLSGDYQACNVRIFRLGSAKVQGKVRPLKVVLRSVDDVISVLRKSSRLKGFTGEKKIFISRDLSKRQVHMKNKILREYRLRKSNGENVKLQYVNGLPKIAEQKNRKQSNDPLQS